CCGLGDVGDAKARMRMGRAQHHRLQHAGGGMVGDVAAGAAEESVVLFARERSAKTEFGRWHGASIPPARAAPPAPARRGAFFPRTQRQPRKKTGEKRTPTAVPPFRPATPAAPTISRTPAPAPIAHTSGMTPKMKANEVIRMGRKRSRAASTA